MQAYVYREQRNQTRYNQYVHAHTHKEIQIRRGSYHFGIPFLESLVFRIFMTESILCTNQLLLLDLERLKVHCKSIIDGNNTLAHERERVCDAIVRNTQESYQNQTFKHWHMIRHIGTRQ